MNTAITFIQDNYVWIAPLVYEIAIRLFKTKKDLSIINAIKDMADKQVPNRIKKAK